MSNSNTQLEDMLNTFARRLAGVEDNSPKEGENDEEDLDKYLDPHKKSKVRKRKKKNKINKKNKKYGG